eukprot:evm.model.scf_1309.1 EVM.evm.TU.scf_1309.1   scf_1309:6013-11281(-)
MNGGAIACLRATLLSMVSVSFVGNSGRDGGAMYVDLEGDPDPQLFFSPANYVNGTNASFARNVASERGGAIFLTAGSAAAPLSRAGISPLGISLKSDESTNKDRQGFDRCSECEFLLPQLTKDSNNNEDDAFFESSRFSNNSAAKSGGALHSERGRVGLRNSVFHDNDAGGSNMEQDLNAMGGAILVKDQGAMHGRNVTFARNAAGLGGCAYASNAIIDFVNATFIENVARLHGGGLYIHAPQEAQFKFGLIARISNAHLNANRANVGGAVYFLVDGSQSGASKLDNLFVVIARSTFTGNEANGTGSVLFTNAPKALDVYCNSDLTVHETTAFDFEEIRSGVTGIERQPGMSISDQPFPCNETWIDNRVSSGGEGGLVSTTAIEVKVCGPVSDICAIEGQMHQIKNHTSGMDLETVVLRLLDLLGNPAIGQPPMLVRVTTNETGTVLSGERIAPVTATTILSSIRLQATVNQTHTLTLMFQPEMLPSVDIEVLVRACLPGEVVMEDGSRCFECPEGHYSFDPSLPCDPCPEDALCKPSVITPEEGYWHSTSKSTQMHVCIFEEACKYAGRRAALDLQAKDAHSAGGILMYTDRKACRQCKTGHRGVLCGACDDGYGMVRSGQCIKCGSRGSGILFAVLAATWIAILSLFMIKNSNMALQTRAVSVPQSDSGETGKPSAARDAASGPGTEVACSSSGLMRSLSMYVWGGELEDQGQGSCAPRRTDRNYASEILKILINFLQVTGIAVFINVHWTTSTLRALGVADFLSSGGEGLVSLECAFPSDASIRRSMYRTVFSLVFPFLLILAIMLVSLMRSSLTSKNWKQVLALWRVSFLSVLYISYIEVSRNALRVLDCTEADEGGRDLAGGTAALGNYWTDDTDQECYKGSHLVVLVALAVPALMLVTIGMPFVIFASIIRIGDKEAHMGAVAFLCQPYRRGRRYWEVLVMLRKSSLAAITVFRFPLGPNLQATLAAAVLMFSVVLHLLVLPFDDRGPPLNGMETMSLTCSIAMLMAGITFNDPHTSTEASIIISAAVLIYMGGVVTYLVVQLAREGAKGAERLLKREGIQVDAGTGPLGKLWLALAFVVGSWMKDAMDGASCVRRAMGKCLFVGRREASVAELQMS